MHTNTQASPIKISSESVDIKQVLFRILSNWIWIVLSLIFAFVLAFLYNRYAEPVYKATAAIMIKDEKKGGADVLDNPLLKGLNLGSGGKLVDNEIEVLKSYDLMEEVVRKKELFLDIKRKGSVTNRSVFDDEIPFVLRIANPDIIEKSFKWDLSHKEDGKWHIKYADDKEYALTKGKWYTIAKLTFQITDNPLFNYGKDSLTSKNEYILVFRSVNISVSRYSSSLNVQPTNKNSSIISLSLSDYNSKKAQAVLMALVGIYNQQALEDKNAVTKNTLDFLNDRLVIIERELRNVEGQVQRFKSSNRITDVSAEAQQHLEQAKEVDFQKAEQQTKLSIVESLENNLKDNQDNPKLVPSGSGITEPTLAEMIQNHNRLVLEKERQSELLGPKNPITVDYNNQIANTRASIITNINSLKQAYRINLNDLNAKDAQLSLRIKNIPQIEKSLVQIQRDQSVKEQLYFLLLQKREESSITLASTTTDSRSIERPRSTGIVMPKTMLIFSLAGLLGLLIPISIIFLNNFFNNTIESREEVEQTCNAPVLGEISYVKNKNDSPFVVQKGSRSIIAEQFRIIRTNISFAKAGHSPKIILVTSNRPEEGKSFASLNLAASYALLDKKVVVLEFDLRKPKLSSALNIQATAGISNYLSDSSFITVDSLLHEVPGFEKRLWLLPTGPIPPNPAELILGKRMSTLMDELNKQFDFIILDTPPYSLVTDSSLLGVYADIRMIVLRQGFTFKWVLQEVNRQIEENPSMPVYTVINRIGEKKGSYKRYGYGYTEYFDTPKKKKNWWQKK